MVIAQGRMQTCPRSAVWGGSGAVSSLAPGPLLCGRLLARGLYIALVAEACTATTLGLNASATTLAGVLLRVSTDTPLCHSAHPLSKKSHCAHEQMVGTSVERCLKGSDCP